MAKFYGNNSDKFTVGVTDVISPSTGEVVEQSKITHNNEVFDLRVYKGGQVIGSNGTIGNITTQNKYGIHYIKNIIYGFGISKNDVGIRCGLYEKTLAKCSINRVISSSEEIQHKVVLHEKQLSGTNNVNGFLFSVYDGAGLANKYVTFYYNRANGLMAATDGASAAVPFTITLPDNTVVSDPASLSLDLRAYYEKPLIFTFNLNTSTTESGTTKIYLSSSSNEGTYNLEATHLSLSIGDSIFSFVDGIGINSYSNKGEKFVIDKKTPSTTVEEDSDKNAWSYFNNGSSNKKIEIQSGDSITFDDATTFTTVGTYTEITNGSDTYPLTEITGTKILSDTGKIATLSSSSLWVERKLPSVSLDLIRNNNISSVGAFGFKRTDEYGNNEQFNGTKYEIPESVVANVFGSVADMKSGDIKPGYVYRTSSYHLGKGYGGNFYLASNKKGVKYDDGIYHLADNGICLELLHDGYVSLFDFGAISNTEAPNDPINDVSDIVDNWLSCGLFPIGSPGHFYFSKTINLSIPNTIELVGEMSIYDTFFEFDIEGNIIGVTTGIVYDNLTRFYTDQNIDMVNFESDHVHIYGGMFHNVGTAHTKAILRFDMDVDMGKLSVRRTTLKGNIPSDNPVEGDGSIGIHWDRSQKIRSGGSVSFSQFDINMFSVGKGILIDDRNTNIAGGTLPDNSWSAAVKMQGHISHYKQAIVSKYYAKIDFEFVIQPYWSLHPNEKDLNTLEIDSCHTLDVDVWDVKDNSTITNSRDGAGVIYMSGSYGYISDGILKGNTYKGYNISAYEIKKPPKNNDSVLANPMNLTINSKQSEGLLNNPSFISPFHNHYAYAHLRNSSIYIKAFTNTGGSFDFETELTGTTSLTESSDITITNPNSMFEFENHQAQTEITFGAGADADNDFIEIKIPISCIGSIFKVLLTNGKYIKKAQLIKVLSGSQETYWLQEGEYFGKIAGGQTYNYLFDFSIRGITSNSGYYILRLIGHTTDTTSSANKYKILEVLAQNIPSTASSSYFPIIHTGGNQEKHGNIKLDQIEVDSSLPSPPSTTSVRGLVSYLTTKLLPSLRTAFNQNNLYPTDDVCSLYPDEANDISQWGTPTRASTAIVTDSVDGSYAIEITTTTGGSSAYVSAPGVSLTIGKSYTVEFWAKVGSAGYRAQRVSFANAFEGNPQTVVDSIEFKKYTKTGVADVSTMWLLVYPSLSAGVIGESIIIDKISVYETKTISGLQEDENLLFDDLNVASNELDLSVNNVYNAASGDTKNYSSFVIKNPKVNKSARVLVQYSSAEISALTGGIPSFTGYTVTETSTSESLIADTEMYMYVWVDDDTSGSEIIRMKITSI